MAYASRTAAVPGADPGSSRHIFLRMMWDTASGRLDPLSHMTFSAFRFRFLRPMSKDEQYAFLEALIGIDPKAAGDVPRIALWLSGNGIPYRLGFRYDASENPIRNLKMLISYRSIVRFVRESRKEGCHAWIRN